MQIDHRLIEKAERNDRLAQKQLYDQYAPALLSVCRLYINDLQFAEDALLKAFFKIFTNLSKYEEQEHFYAWMRRIAVNECIDFLKSKAQKLSFADWSDTYDTIDDVYLENETFSESEIQSFVDQLPTACRTVFNLYVFEDYSHKQIAEELSISEGTSKSQLAYAKKLLQQHVTSLKMWKDNIQRLFRYRKINPSPALWEQLEAQLAESETLPTEQKRRKLWYYTAAAAVLLCLAIGYLWQQYTETNNDLQVSKKLIVVKSSVPTTSPHPTVPTTLKDSQCSSYPSILKNSQYDSYLTSSEEVITLIDINAVDTLFTQYTANAIQNRITKQMETQMAADLQHLSPEYLALVATTQAELNQYVTEKYQQDKTFNTIEKEQLKDKVKLLAEKLLKEIGTRVVLNNKS